MADVPVKLGGKTQAWVNANPNHLLLERQHLYILDGANAGKFAIGDGVTLLGALTFYGGSSSGLTIGTTTITSGTNTRILYNNAGVVGEYLVTGTGTTAVLSTSPVFTTDITTPLIKGVGGFIQTFSTDAVNIGNKTTTSQRIVRIGQDTAWIDVGSAVGFTSYSAMYFNTTTPALATYAIASDGIDMLLNAPGTNGAISLRTANNIRMTVNRNGASLALVNIDFLVGANTNQTLSTNIPSFRVQGASKQWATGTLATQYFNHFTANTVAFVGASTASEVFGTYIEGATAGTNATITNNFALGLLTGTSTIKLGNLTGSSTLPAIYLNQATPSSTNYALGVTAVGGTVTVLNASSAIRLRLSNTDVVTINSTDMSWTPFNSGSGAVNNYTFNTGTHTNQTLSTNIPNFKVTGSTKQWATGALATQYFNYFSANTVAFVGASTATNVYGLYVEAATAGTNATITNNYAAGFGGNVICSGFFRSGTYVYAENDFRIAGAVILDYSSTTLQVATSSFFQSLSLRTNGLTRLTLSTTDLTFSDSYNLIFNATTGTKIGTATTQKIGFWNATPIVQPTTAGAASTLTSNGGTTLTSTDTIDGYTLLQVVKALRNTGLLA